MATHPAYFYKYTRFIQIISLTTGIYTNYSITKIDRILALRLPQIENIVKSSQSQSNYHVVAFVEKQILEIILAHQANLLIQYTRIDIVVRCKLLVVCKYSLAATIFLANNNECGILVKNAPHSALVHANLLHIRNMCSNTNSLKP